MSLEMTHTVCLHKPDPNDVIYVINLPDMYKVYTSLTPVAPVMTTTSPFRSVNAATISPDDVGGPVVNLCLTAQKFRALILQ